MNKEQGKGALEIIEEALHLLRMAPMNVLASYYIGGLPFILGLLYFWAEMSQSAFAYERCAPAAFVVALLFLWMKTWHVLFAHQFRAHVVDKPPPRWSFPTLVNIAITQTVIQPSGLFLLPVALALLLPFRWTYVFYENVTAIGHVEPMNPHQVVRKAARQASLWPRQSLVLLLVLLVFGGFVFLNLAAAVILIPHLIRMFFGIESVFTRTPQSVLNSTLLAADCGLTYLCLDPLLKAVSVLRCFYGESMQSGEDLRTELRSLRFAQRN